MKPEDIDALIEAIIGAASLEEKVAMMSGRGFFELHGKTGVWGADPYRAGAGPVWIRPPDTRLSVKLEKAPPGHHRDLLFEACCADNGLDQRIDVFRFHALPGRIFGRVARPGFLLFHIARYVILPGSEHPPEPWKGRTGGRWEEMSVFQYRRESFTP